MHPPRDLHPFPVADVFKQRCRVMTMTVGQWDALLSNAYEQGWILLELDDDERPVKAYRKTEGTNGIP